MLILAVLIVPQGWLCDRWGKKGTHVIYVFVLLYPTGAEKSGSIKMLKTALLSGLEGGGWVVESFDFRQMFYSLL